MSSCCKVVVWLAVLAIMPIGFVEAGFIAGSVNVDFDDEWTPGDGKPPWAGGPPSWAGEKPDFVFEITSDKAEGLLELKENYGGPETLAHVISGATDGDPVMNITKEINNDSGFTWHGFLLTMPDGGNIVFTGTPSCDAFTLISQDNYNVVFGTPSPLEHGESMVLSFSVLIPSTGPFNFTLTQTPVPVPEPSVLFMLIIGSACLIIRYRKR